MCFHLCINLARIRYLCLSLVLLVAKTSNHFSLYDDILNSHKGGEKKIKRA